jgi:hypothetical protein
MKTLLSHISLHKQSNHYLILGVAWAIMQSILLYQFRIVTDFEATKYIEQANLLINNGSYSSNNFIFYSTEILLITACKKLQIGYWPVVAIQLLCNAISVFCFYKLTEKFTGKIRVAFWLTLLFIGMYYYHLYNVYLFTESLYFSFSIAFFYILMSIEKLSVRSLLVIAVGLSMLYFTRPVGIFFIPAAFLFLVFKFYPKKAVLIFSTAGLLLIVVFFFALNQSLNSGGELDFLLPYLDERIICGVPTISVPHKISMPVEKDSVQGLFYVITHHWRLFLALSVKRLLAFFGVLRSYYSLSHNLFIGAYFYSLYVLIFVGIRKWNKGKAPEICFILCLIFFTALTTALSCDEWHNRFILAILPFLLLLASLAFAKPLPKNDFDANG